jgi:hypothetical protein
MKAIRSKLWSVASGNQTVSGSGGGRDQNQSIPDFVRGYKLIFLSVKHGRTFCNQLKKI